MQTLRDLAMSYVGIPYKFGGKNPLTGFDCSGLACELLMSSGVLPHHTELNAQGLYDLLEKTGSVDRWGMGSLAFFGVDPKNIVHVGFCLDQYRMIEAGGGDHTTLLTADAAAKNACVRIRPIKYRKDFFAVVKPNYATIGVIA
jgi:cell wall-associated NlpC family hydrolase